MAVLMVFPANSTGIELCGSDLRFAITRSAFGKLQLIALHEIAGFTTMNDLERKKAVQALVKNNRIPVSRVFLALPREHGIVRQIDLPAELAEKLADIVKPQVEMLSPWPVDEVYWDFGFDPPKKNRKLMTVTIAIVPRAFLDPWIAFFKDAGLPLSGATLSSLAYGHGVSSFWNQSTPTLILDREEDYTEGVLISGNRIAAAKGPAEAVVRQLLSAGKLSSPEGCRFIFFGRTVDPADLDENPRIPLENAKPQSTAAFGSIATSLVALKESPFRANLIPRDMRYRESRLQLVPTYVLVFLAICMGLALVAREPYQNAVYASRLDSEIRKISPQVTEVAGQESELNQLSTRSRALTQQLQNREYNLEALRELARVLPATAFLSSYSYQDGAITVSGFAQSASEIQNLLESSSLFKNVEFTSSVIRDAGGKDRFTLKMLIEASQ